MTFPLPELREIFGQKLQEGVRLANYTTSHTGGPVLALIPVNTLEELRFTVKKLWELEVEYRVLGSGSNILVSDKGYLGVVILNRCHNLRINSQLENPIVKAESGVNLGVMSRQVALRGLTGLEWTSSIPGTVGGAVYGNAGAFCSDVASVLKSAKILTPEGERDFDIQAMGYEYRSSIFKRTHIPAVILEAIFNVQSSTREAALQRVKELTEKRKASQPQGPSFGSTFRNPAGDSAGRLIEAAGLKGYSLEHAGFSPMHANFIVNDGQASAQEYYRLIRLAQERVKAQFGIDLELEIELLGEFDES